MFWTGYWLGVFSFFIVVVCALLVDLILRAITKHIVNSVRLGAFPIETLISTYGKHSESHLIHLFGRYFLTDKIYVIKADRYPSKKEIKKLKNRG